MSPKNPKNKLSPSLDGALHEQAIAALIDDVKAGRQKRDLVVNLLPRNHEVYKGRGTNQVNRIRGYALAGFEDVGLPEEALVYVCEELDNGHSPYVIAASAKAIRGLAQPASGVGLFLTKALRNVGHKDEALSFSSYYPEWPLKDFTTATQEILKSLAWLGAYAKEAIPFLQRYIKGEIISINFGIQKQARETLTTIEADTKALPKSCCDFPKRPSKHVDNKDLACVKELMLQDQDGNSVPFGDYFNGSFSVLAFFYTRCDNPNKCSMTVTRLGQLQRMLADTGLSSIKIAAITYDPVFDTPKRIKEYSANRGLVHNAGCKVFRTLREEDQELLQRYLTLQVNYMGSIVNQHSIELFILNKKGIKIREYSKMEFDNTVILKDLKRKSRSLIGPTGLAISGNNTLFPLLFLFFPKCPLCWATYISALGLTGISWLQYSPNMIWALFLFAGINLIFMYTHTRKSGSYVPLILACAGYVGLFLAFWLDTLPIFKFGFAGLVLLSSLLTVRAMGSSFPSLRWGQIIGTAEKYK